jgi:hypothetical protein
MSWCDTTLVIQLDRAPPDGAFLYMFKMLKVAFFYGITSQLGPRNVLHAPK